MSSSERYDSIWKDPFKYFTQRNVATDSKSMLREQLIEDEERKETGENEIIDVKEYIENYHDYGEFYFKNKGRIRRYAVGQVDNEGVSGKDDDDEDDLKILEEILQHLPTSSSPTSPSPATSSIPTPTSDNTNNFIDSIILSCEYNLLHLSIKFNDFYLVKLLLKYQASLSFPDLKQGNISLHYAAMNGNSNILNLLIQTSLNKSSSHLATLINHQNNYGKTPLHYCCEYGYDDCVSILLQCRPSINVNICDHNGNTSLHLACIDGNLLIVQYLLIANCDHYITNNEHKTPFDVIRTMSNREAIQRELESHTNPSSPSSSSLSTLATQNGAEPQTKSLSPQSQASALDLFDGMVIKEASETPFPVTVQGQGQVQVNDTAMVPYDQDIFSGLTLNSSPPHTPQPVPIPIDTPRHLTTTYLHNKFENPAAIPLTPLIPIGRWVVMQSNKFVIDSSSGKLIIHRNKKSAAQWGQRWRSQFQEKNSTSMNIPVITPTSNNSLSNESSSQSPSPSPSTPTSPSQATTPGDLLTKFKQFTEKIKSSFSLSSSNNESDEEFLFLQSFPAVARATVTSRDDNSELLVAEISNDHWSFVIENYPIYVMEVEGSDPLFEQYLKDRNVELRKRRLSLQRKTKEINQEVTSTDLRSSFIASNSLSNPLVLSPTGDTHERLSNELQHFSLLVGNEILSDEEILLNEEIQQIQQQISITEKELISLENEIQSWLSSPPSSPTKKMTENDNSKNRIVEKQVSQSSSSPSSPSTNKIDLTQFEQMLEINSSSSIAKEENPHNNSKLSEVPEVSEELQSPTQSPKPQTPTLEIKQEEKQVEEQDEEEQVEDQEVQIEDQRDSDDEEIVEQDEFHDSDDEDEDEDQDEEKLIDEVSENVKENEITPSLEDKIAQESFSDPQQEETNRETNEPQLESFTSVNGMSQNESQDSVEEVSVIVEESLPSPAASVPVPPLLPASVCPSDSHKRDEIQEI